MLSIISYIMTQKQTSKFDPYKNKDIRGTPMKWKENAKVAFRSFYALRVLAEGAREGNKPTPEAFKKVWATPEAEKHADDMVENLESAATSRGWTVCILQPQVSENLPGAINLDGPLGCVVLGLERDDGKISPIAFDARTVLYQTDGGIIAPRYTGAINFDKELRGLEPCGFEKTFI